MIKVVSVSVDLGQGLGRVAARGHHSKVGTSKVPPAGDVTPLGSITWTRASFLSRVTIRHLGLCITLRYERIDIGNIPAPGHHHRPSSSTLTLSWIYVPSCVFIDSVSTATLLLRRDKARGRQPSQTEGVIRHKKRQSNPAGSLATCDLRLTTSRNVLFYSVTAALPCGTTIRVLLKTCSELASSSNNHFQLWAYHHPGPPTPTSTFSQLPELAHPSERTPTIHITRERHSWLRSLPTCRRTPSRRKSPSSKSCLSR